MNIHPLWYVCITVRLSMVYAVYFLLRNESKIKNKKLIKNIITTIFLIFGLGFIRKGILAHNNEYQIAKVFWQETRYVHGALFLLAGIYLLLDNLNMCLLVLGLDVVFSILYRITFDK
jgi:hypothetical protein